MRDAVEGPPDRRDDVALAALRAIPGLDVVRPADANETAFAWREMIRRHTGASPRPIGLILSRQNLPVLAGARADGVARGGYVLADAPGLPDVIVVATGSEMTLALGARDALAGELSVRVVSMPCVEWFDEQDEDYRESILPSAVSARVSVEAAIGQSWWRILGSDGRHVGLEHYGASADQGTLYREFGITVDAVVDAARASHRAATAR